MKPDRGEDTLGSRVRFPDRSSSSGVAGGDDLGAENIGFHAAIKVNLEWGGRLETGGNQHTADLNGIDGAGTILTGRMMCKYIAVKQVTISRQNAHRQHLGYVRLRESSS